MSAQKFWAVINEDGRHSLMSRGRIPDDTAVRQVTRYLSENNMVAWLALITGDYYSIRGDFTVEFVRSLSGQDDPAAANAAKEKFLERRMQSLIPESKDSFQQKPKF